MTSRPLSFGLPNVVESYFQECLNEFNRILTIIKQITPIIPNILTHHRENPEHGAYENNGNTSCKGTEYFAYFIVPVGRELQDADQEWWSFYHGSQDCCIIYDASIVLRDRDAKPWMKMSGVHVSPFVVDFHQKNTTKRIDYNTNGLTTLNDRQIIQMVDMVSEIFRMKELEQKVTRAKYLLSQGISES